MKNLYASLTAIGGLALASTASANHIDFIADGGFMLSATDATTTGTQLGAGGNILGAERNVTLVGDIGLATAGLTGVPTGPGAVGPDVGSVISFASSAATAGDSSIGSLTLLYNGVGGAGLGGSDFSTQWNAISVNLPSVTGSLDLRLTVADSDNSDGFSSIGNVTTGGIYNFLFADTGFSGVDFSMVDSVQLDIDTTVDNTSFDLAEITREVVPEPSSGVLALVGCLGFIVRRRRNA